MSSLQTDRGDVSCLGHVLRSNPWSTSTLTLTKVSLWVLLIEGTHPFQTARTYANHRALPAPPCLHTASSHKDHDTPQLWISNSRPQLLLSDLESRVSRNAERCYIGFVLLCCLNLDEHVQADFNICPQGPVILGAKRQKSWLFSAVLAWDAVITTVVREEPGRPCVRRIFFFFLIILREED